MNQSISARKSGTEAAGTAAAETTGAKAKKPGSSDPVRETVESVAIAFVLAFLFKTGVAELYVIPTGSMAPTLYGRHKEITCQGCGFEYDVGASREIDQHSGVLIPGMRVRTSQCPNCRLNADVLDAPVFNGDRILVDKTPQEFRRFEVVVFKNPEEAHVNYIKRLIGLPGETIRIRKGDIWARRGETAPWEIQRKDRPEVQDAIQIPVYDDSFPPTALLEAGWPERWASAVPSTQDGNVGGWLQTGNAWSGPDGNRSYSAEPGDSEFHWLRYRHLIPSDRDWLDLEAGRALNSNPAASLVADFCSFNSDTSYHGWRPPAYWVGDLTVRGRLRVYSTETDGMVVLELVEGLRTFQCRISPQDGSCQVGVIDRLIDRTNTRFDVMATGMTGISGAGEHEFAFANVDDRVLLWVDGDPVPLEGETSYDGFEAAQPTDLDLAPVGIAIRNCSVSVDELRIDRDIYYCNEIMIFAMAEGTTDPDALVRSRSVIDEGYRDTLSSLLHSPSAWADSYHRTVAMQEEEAGELLRLTLDDDEYLMMGDNSPSSKDGRLFDYYTRPMTGIYSHRHAVRRQDLIGRALVLVWPHARPFLNNGQGFGVREHVTPDGETDGYPSLRLPFYPNFSRMKKIR